MRNVITPTENLLDCISQASFLNFSREKFDYIYNQRVRKHYMYYTVR